MHYWDANIGRCFMKNANNRLEVDLPSNFSPYSEVVVPRLLTVKELCEWLQLSRMQISRLINKGVLRACKFGTSKQSSLRFLVSEVLEDLEKLRVVPSEGGDNE